MQVVGAARQRVLIYMHLVLATICAWVRRMLMQARRILCALWQLFVPPALDGSPTQRAYSLPDGILGPCEVERLTTLRQRFLGRPEYIECGISERKLLFARWLVEHGHLSEFPPLAGEMSLQDDPSAPHEPTDCARGKHEPELLAGNLPSGASPSVALLPERTREADVSIPASP